MKELVRLATVTKVGGAYAKGQLSHDCNAAISMQCMYRKIRYLTFSFVEQIKYLLFMLNDKAVVFIKAVGSCC